MKTLAHDKYRWWSSIVSLTFIQPGTRCNKSGPPFFCIFLVILCNWSFFVLQSVLWSFSVVKGWKCLNQRCLANLLYYEILYMYDVGWWSVTQKKKKMMAYRNEAMVTNEFYCNVIRRIRWEASVRAARSKSSTLHTKRTARWLEGKDEVFYQGNRRTHFLGLW